MPLPPATRLRSCVKCDRRPLIRRAGGVLVFYCPRHGEGSIETVEIKDVSEARWAYEQAKAIGELP
jgi:hypothetical protein